MRLARTIVAVVIAMSVAMLPTAGPASISAKSSHELTVSADMAMAMDDCCPDHSKPCNQGGDQCQSMASCVHHTFSFLELAVSHIAYSLVLGDELIALVDQAVPLHAAGAPFRPPRV